MPLAPLQVAIQTGRRHVALDDVVYSEILKRNAGVDSSRDLNDAGAERALLELRSKGFQPGLKSGSKSYRGKATAQQPLARKARALWLALWNLDETETAAESALTAFAKGITGKDDLRFCTGPGPNRVVEGLKAWVSRVGCRLDGNPIDARRTPVREQWVRLHARGWVKIKGDTGLQAFAHRTWCTPNAGTVDQLETDHLDKLATKLGPIVREQRCERRHQ